MPRTHQSVHQTSFPGVRAVRLRTDHTFAKHSHDEFGIGVITDGAHRSTSGQGVVEAEKGDVITVTPGEIHDGAPLSGASRSWTMLYFEPGIVAAHIEAEEFGSPESLEFHQPVVHGLQYRERFARVLRLASTKELLESEMQSEEALTSLFSGLLRRKTTCATTNANAAERVLELINDAPSAPHTLSGLAQAGGLSRYQAIRAVERQTGLTPFAYIRQCRLDRARRLVLAGMPIAEAAIEAGFSDQSHLTRTFKAAYGFTPSALLQTAE